MSTTTINNIITKFHKIIDELDSDFKDIKEMKFNYGIFKEKLPENTCDKTLDSDQSYEPQNDNIEISEDISEDDEDKNLINNNSEKFSKEDEKILFGNMASKKENFGDKINKLPKILFCCQMFTPSQEKVLFGLNDEESDVIDNDKLLKDTTTLVDNTYDKSRDSDQSYEPQNDNTETSEDISEDDEDKNLVDNNSKKFPKEDEKILFDNVTSKKENLKNFMCRQIFTPNQRKVLGLNDEESDVIDNDKASKDTSTLVENNCVKICNNDKLSESQIKDAQENEYEKIKKLMRKNADQRFTPEQKKLLFDLSDEDSDISDNEKITENTPKKTSNKSFPEEQKKVSFCDEKEIIYISSDDDSVDVQKDLCEKESEYVKYEIGKTIKNMENYNVVRITLSYEFGFDKKYKKWIDLFKTEKNVEFIEKYLIDKLKYYDPLIYWNSSEGHQEFGVEVYLID